MLNELVVKKPLHDTIGYFDLRYLQEDMIEYNQQVICSKHARYWSEQLQRDLKRKLTQACVNGDEGHNSCSMASCECHCHYNQRHDGRYWRTKVNDGSES